MKKKFSYATVCLGICCLLILILDSRTAVSGAAEGVQLSIQTVVPSLFPFMVISSVLTTALTGTNIPFLRPLGTLCAIPRGCETLFLIGLLSGYPVGAKCVIQAHSQGRFSRAHAQRMIGFFSNAGPAFLFGIGSSVFSSVRIVWVVWAIQLLSALLAGILLPDKQKSNKEITVPETYTSSGQAVRESVRSLGIVCGWVVVFRVILAFLDKWCFTYLPTSWTVLLSGVVEITNGCVMLHQLEPEWLRFLYFNGFLSFGGICVVMQTAGIIGDIGIQHYLKGKLLQTGISLLLSLCFCYILFPNAVPYNPLIPGIWAIIIVLGVAFLHKKKNNSRFSLLCRV